jgi:hypothetical protein
MRRQLRSLLVSISGSAQPSLIAQPRLVQISHYRGDLEAGCQPPRSHEAEELGGRDSATTALGAAQMLAAAALTCMMQGRS